MSRKQLQLEGNSVEEVLKRVESKFGNTAHVVGAEKVRSGGIGGFFAREYYVVTVDVPAGFDQQDEGPALGTRDQSVGGNATAPSLARSMPRQHVTPGATQSQTASQPPAQPDRRKSEAPVGAQLSGIEAMLAAADLADGFAPDTSSGGEAAQGPATPANPARPTPIYSRVREPQADTGAVQPQRTTHTKSAEEPRTNGPTIRPAVFEILMPDKDKPPTTPEHTPGTADQDTRVQTARERHFDSILRSARAMAEQPLASLHGSTPAKQGPTESTQPGPHASQPLDISGTAGLSGSPEPLVTAPEGVTLMDLAQVGIPRRILELLPRDKTHYTLSEVLRHVPKPPKLWPESGSIVVVLGVGTSAQPTAKLTAHKIGVREQDITAAGTLSAETARANLVLTAQSARALRKKAREELESVVVFLDIGPSQTDWYLSGRLLAALDPDYLLAAVRADHDMSHAAHCITEVAEGRPLYSVAVEAVVGTLSPARVLSLGVPVSHLDTMEANAVVWAAAISTALPAIRWD